MGGLEVREKRRTRTEKKDEVEVESSEERSIEDEVERMREISLKL